MKLSAYLEANSIKPSAFAATVGVPASTILRVLNGKRDPGLDLLRKIMAATDGAVTPNDFLPDQEPAPSRPFRGDEAEGHSGEARGACGPQGAGETAFVEGADAAEAGPDAVPVAPEAVRAAE